MLWYVKVYRRLICSGILHFYISHVIVNMYKCYILSQGGHYEKLRNYKKIRSSLNFTQNELAEKLGVSFATVNRWEKGHCEPSQIAVNTIKNFCMNNNIDFSQFDENKIINSNEIITLYHGSKSGIHGTIAPASRKLNRSKGILMAEEICRRYRREGRFFDEILEAGE